MLGNHEDANEDADTALKDDDTFVPALLAKAEAQYHQGSFEHALIYFFRYLKMSYLNFLILAFSTNFCPIKTDLSGNTV